MGGILKPLLVSLLASQAFLAQAQTETIDLTGKSPAKTFTDTALGKFYLLDIGRHGADVTVSGSYSLEKNLLPDPTNPNNRPGVWTLLTLSDTDKGSFSLNIANLNIPALPSLPPGTHYMSGGLTLATVVLNNGDANGNKLTIDGASSDLSGVGAIFGATTANGSANDNVIKSTSDLILSYSAEMTGGFSSNGDANLNKVIVSGNINRTTIAGGRATNGNAEENRVELTGAGVINDVWGGQAKNGNASSNVVELTYSGAVDNVHGGEGEQRATGNTVILHPTSADLNIRSMLCGGYALQADNNTIVIEEGFDVSAQFVRGGQSKVSYSGDPMSASGNSVAIYSGSRFLQVAGGNGSYMDALSQANNNKVTIDTPGVYIQDVLGGGAYTANFNQVYFKQGKAYRVYGGSAGPSPTQAGATANNNLVFIENATATVVAGGLAGQDASENRVFLKNATTIKDGIPGNVYGGYVYVDKGEKASQNIVVLLGTTTVDGDVYGAYSENPNVQTISQNSVTLDGNVKVKGGVYAAAVAGQGNIGDKNELVFRGKTSVGTIGGFTDLHLLVSDENILNNNNEYVLTITGTNTLDLTGKNIDVYDFRAPASIPDGGKFGLIKVDNAQGGAPSIQLGGDVTLHNTFVDKRWEVKHETAGELYLQGEKLIIQPPAPGTNPSEPIVVDPTVTANKNSESLSQSRLSSIASANQSAQFAVDSGLNAMKDQLYGKNWFFVGEGGTNKYGHGLDKVDLNGGAMLTGPMNNFGGTLVGGFFEASWGHASSKEAAYSAKSNIQSYGVGVLANREVLPNLEVNGSLRFGWMRNSFKGRYFDVGSTSDFKTHVPYFSLHIGADYTFPISNSIEIVPYGRYILSYVGSDKVKVSGEGDRYKADKTVAHTLRAGVKVKTQLSENFKVIAGAAVDETMGAKAKGSISGYDLKTVSMNGTTGVGELKLQAVPTSASPWKFEVGVKGYVGQRRGFMGDASVNYRF